MSNDELIPNEAAHRALPPPEDLRNLHTIAHVVYALHAFAVCTGVLGSATILGSFLASLPSIAAVVLNYVKQGAVRGTWLEGHYRWQIRTFWYALLWVVLSFVLILTIIGAIIGLAMLAVTTVWVIYRIARGWWRLGQRRTMPGPFQVSSSG